MSSRDLVKEIVDVTFEPAPSVMQRTSRRYLPETFRTGWSGARADLAGFERDYALWLALAPVAQQLGQFQELFDDTMTALSSDLYTEALAVYSYLKAGGADAGLNDVRAAIGKRFARRPVAATTAPATASHA